MQKRAAQGYLRSNIIALALVGGLFGAALFYLLAIHGSSPGAIWIGALPCDVEVSINGAKQGSSTPLTVENLKPNYYVVSARKDGHEPWSEAIEVKPNETTSVIVELKARAMASLELRTRPSGAEVLLDGRVLAGWTPLRIKQITPGAHRLEVRKPPYYRPWVHEFDIQADEKARLFAKLLPR